MRVRNAQTLWGDLSVRKFGGDMSDSVGFWKFQKKSMKIGKIRLKRTRDEGATVKSGILKFGRS
jgi:hypothetical protein